jgi:hypothetical protein
VKVYAKDKLAGWFYETPEPQQAHGPERENKIEKINDTTNTISPTSTSTSSTISTTNSMENVSSEVIRNLLIRAREQKDEPLPPALERIVELAPYLPPNFSTSYELGMAALKSLPLIEQVNVLQEYGEMSSSIMSWLQSIRDSGRTVTEADVHAFFNNLKDTNRRVRRRY